MIDDTCPVCGLPKELCVCGDMEKTTSVVEIKTERRKYGKLWAVVSGLDSNSSQDLKTIVKAIKNKLACAGTVKGKNIEVLYGRNERTKELIDSLVELGFNKDSIHVTGLK
jgi:translation initiation factor 1